MRDPSRRTRTAADGRGGFTLLEVLVALVILSFVVLGAQASITALMVRDVSWQEQRSRATQIAMDRVHAIQSDPVYGSIKDTYEEEGTEIEGGYLRDTHFAVTDFADGTEYLTVTVTVGGRNLPRPVTRTTVIASP
ncbi:MAG TPA: prepilin-type N-terminal cleavage/methylation domain-containing protein [Longimicrobium sp.]|nr:prepilin-type N-terminal cleavage/methylation domain-containing protein [Longimicrobium sp.]